MAKARKTAIITGAARRIGRATALYLGEKGWDLILHYHKSSKDIRTLSDELTKKGISAETISADLSDITGIQKLTQSITAHKAPPSLLINNASIFQYDNWKTADETTLQENMHLHLTAPLLLSQSFAKTLPKGEKGLIINMLDQRVWKPTPHFLSYSLSKSALWSMTIMLAQALAPHIRVNAIGPGPALPSTRQSEADFQKTCQSLPLQCGTTPQEIAHAIGFLWQSPSLTGQMIALDGGQHLAWQTPDIMKGKE